MKKTFVTTMPDHVGAFLKASRVFASLSVNITRVSYNKAVDMHTLFIEAEASPDRLEQAVRRLREIGSLPGGTQESRVLLLEFKLRDVPGAVSSVLELIMPAAAVIRRWRALSGIIGRKEHVGGLISRA